MSMLAVNARVPWEFWPWALEIALLLGGAILVWIRKRQAPSWPSTQGVIWTATADEIGEGRRLFPHWVAELTYSYSVNGDYFSGTYRMSTLTKGRAEERVEGWKGRSVVVRYHPENPSLSVLLRSDQVGGHLGN